MNSRLSRSPALADMYDGLPVVAALLLAFAADALLTGWAVVAIVACVAVLTLSYLARRDRSPQEHERRAARRRWENGLEAGERRAVRLIRFAPLGVGVAAGLAWDGGFDAEAFAAGTAAAFVLGQLLLVAWFAQRSGSS